ncbi:hypothetical protein TPR58_22380 [Sphingomonas sp. HF-S3]|uniref:Uncharacterized protein n=1 Tax=Sphingomonas rustica TaxID=3103142 RepID=A0ABV0BHU3_9SPHN
MFNRPPAHENPDRPVTVYLDPAVCDSTPLHFCRVFANLSDTVCAKDTPDGNPYTCTLLTPGQPDVIVTVDDESSHNPELAEADDYEPQYNILKRHGPPPLAWG